MKLTFVLLLSIVTTLARPNPRIVGGQIAYAGEFPYVAALYISKESGTFFCSGALLNEEWILTAGSCVDGAVTISVVLGTTKLDSTEDSVVKSVSTTTVIHPDFDATDLNNDIGLVQLSEPVEYTTRIRPVYLPESTLEESVAGQVLGWGKTSDADSGLTNTLNYVTLWSLSDSDCKTAYGSQIVGNMACFTSNEPQGTCQGDSGSPIIQHLVGGNTVILGVSSFVSKSGCENGDPSGFTKVYEYVDWITETAGL